MSNVRRRSPRQPCELEWVADFGYGDPEWFPCTRPATHRARETTRYRFGYPVREVIHMCAAHAGTDPTAYRYRTIR